MEPCIWGRMAPPVASAGFELVALARGESVAVEGTWVWAVDWLAGAAVSRDCDETMEADEVAELRTEVRTEVEVDAALVVESTPTAVATGRVSVEMSTEAGGAPSLTGGMPAETATAMLATTSCEARIAMCV